MKVESAQADSHWRERVERENTYTETRILLSQFEAVLSRFSEDDVCKLRDALDVSMAVHIDDSAYRSDGPYINHILRVTLKLAEDFAVQDADVLIASLLHDSVEDQRGKIIALQPVNAELSSRMQALTVLQTRFNLNVANIVALVTNPDACVEFGFSPEERAAHTQEILTHADASILKLADFLDNALQVANTQNALTPEICASLSRKYFAVAGVYEKWLKEGNSSISEPLRTSLITSISHTREVMGKYLQTIVLA